MPPQSLEDRHRPLQQVWGDRSQRFLPGVRRRCLSPTTPYSADVIGGWHVAIWDWRFITILGQLAVMLEGLESVHQRD